MSDKENSDARAGAAGAARLDPAAHSIAGDLQRRLLHTADQIQATCSHVSPELLRDAAVTIGEWIARFNKIMELQRDQAAGAARAPLETILGRANVALYQADASHLLALNGDVIVAIDQLFPVRATRAGDPAAPLKQTELERLITAYKRVSEQPFPEADAIWLLNELIYERDQRAGDPAAPAATEDAVASEAEYQSHQPSCHARRFSQARQFSRLNLARCTCDLKAKGDPAAPQSWDQGVADAAAGIERAADKRPALMNPETMRHIAANLSLWADHALFLRTRTGAGDPAAPPFERNGLCLYARVVCINVPRLKGTVIRCAEDGVDVRWDDGTHGELVWSEAVAHNAYRLQVFREVGAGDPAPAGWQPIDTAPKDGTRFLAGLHHPTYGWLCGLARHYDDPHVPDGYFVMDSGGDPTYWQPLPPAPAGPSPQEDVNGA